MSDAAPLGASRLRRALAKGALALAATALALGVGELVARLAVEAAPRLLPPPPPTQPGLRELQGIFELAQPFVRGIYKGVLHRTNSMGVRGPELALEPRPGVLRIAVLGDSIAMGQGIEESDTYAARLALLLAQEDPRRDYEVVNLGLSGVTASHAAHRLEYVGLRYHPQLIVYGYTLNDIEGPEYQASAPRDRDALRRLLARYQHSPSGLLRAVWPRLVLAWSAFRPLPGSYELELVKNYRENPAAWREVEGALERIAAQGREGGLCALLFIHPRLQDLSWLHAYTPFYDQVAQAARARGFHVASGFDALRGERASALRLSELDPHPNAEGHRLLAEALRDAILSLPPACLEAHPRPRAGPGP